MVASFIFSSTVLASSTTRPKFQNTQKDLIYYAKLAGFEIKYNPKKVAKIPPAFRKLYPEASFEVVNPETVYTWLK